MLKPGGYMITTDPDPTKSRGQTAVIENDTVTCGHNGELIKVPPNCPAHLLPYALCWGCRRYICLRCDAIRAKTLTCDVIENKLERAEAAAAFHRSIG